MKPTAPLLTPPCKGWQEDFTLPYEPPNKAPSTLFLPLNHINNIYLETFRSTITMRNLIPICLTLDALALCIILEVLTDSLRLHNHLFSAIGLTLLLLIAWQTTSFLRVLRLAPRDEPIRFNRARQKIYAYNFSFCWWNPFIAWPIEVVSYDWVNVRAERWRKQAVTHQGSHIVKVGITLSIVAPGTNKVIDRFPLSVVNDDESIWAYICTYMQQGPSAVPTPPPGPDHNDLLWYQYTKRLAPKVNWPEDIDRESRTKP